MKPMLLAAIILLCLRGYAQLSIFTVLPGGVVNVAYGDTILNNAAILKQNGITTITTQVTPRSITPFNSRTIHLSANGRIESVENYFHVVKNDSTICLRDTFLYNPRGGLQKFIARDGGGNVYMQCWTDFVTGQRIRYTWISTSSQKAIPDTDISYRYYNNKGQLTRIEWEGNRITPINASLYYGEDGLLDSIKDDNLNWGTYIFKRKQSRRTKEIELETEVYNYKWTYNALGQCIALQWMRKSRSRFQTTREQTSISESEYYYNPDGTLSKVVEKREGKKFATTSYTYTK